MSAWLAITFVIDGVIAVLMIATVIAIYYAISFAVLWLVGKALPLTGRRRH